VVSRTALAKGVATTSVSSVLAKGEMRAYRGLQMASGIAMSVRHGDSRNDDNSELDMIRYDASLFQRL
jgi:hypothetical protein